MRAQTSIRWTLHVEGPLTLNRPCPRCDRTQPFTCTERFRVNASGRKLDVWLLFDCSACGRTWRLPVHERHPVSEVPPWALEAFHSNDARLAARLAAEHGAVSGVRVEGPPPDGPAMVALTVPPGVKMRLDRVLATALGLSRAEVVRAWAAGELAAVPSDPKALRRPVVDGLVLWVNRSGTNGDPLELPDEPPV